MGVLRPGDVASGHHGKAFVSDPGVVRRPYGHSKNSLVAQRLRPGGARPAGTAWQGVMAWAPGRGPGERCRRQGCGGVEHLGRLGGRWDGLDEGRDSRLTPAFKSSGSRRVVLPFI